MKIQLPGVLPTPPIPEILNHKVHWLSGEGAGSWFLIERKSNYVYEVTRYSPTGNLECQNEFSSNEILDLNVEYALSYPCHCATVTIIQNRSTVTLNAI